MEAALLSLNVEKAFELVKWGFLYKVLTKFGFHMRFTEIIRILYDESCTKIKISRYLSDPFELESYLGY